MKLNRRGFIRSAAVLGTLGLTELDAMAARRGIESGGEQVDEEDEAYWGRVRLLFPLTKDLMYLNNGTMGPSPYPVIDAVQSGMMGEDKMGMYGGYEPTIGKIAKLVGANEDEIGLTHNTTEGINIGCWGLPLRRGDEVIVTTHEHVGNALPWLNRQQVHGIMVKAIRPASTAAETLNVIAAAISKRTRVIAIPHIPCTQGQVMPVKDICRLAKDKGLYTVIDGAHGPGMLVLDLHDIGCDVYVSCCHKWMLGPKGTGFIYVRKAFQDTLQAYFVGAGGGAAKPEWSVISHPTTFGGYADSAHRYWGGTQSTGLYKGVGAAVDFIESIGMDNIHRRIKSLGKYTQDALLSIGPRLELLTPTEESSRCAINGFRIKGVDSTKFFNQCLEHKVRIRRVAEDGLDSLRVSTHIYNNRTEVDALVAEIKKALA